MTKKEINFEGTINGKSNKRWIKRIKAKTKQKEINLSFDILQQLSKEGKISAYNIEENEWIDAESPMILERNYTTVKKIIKQMGF